MTELRSQKIMASRILNCGVTRVWINPERIADVEEAITAEDIRSLIKDGIISARQKKGASNFRKKKIQLQKKKGRRRGTGSRKGHVSGVAKRNWINRIRAIRSLLRDLKAEKKIDGKTYRMVYTKSKSGIFRSRSHVMIYLERNNLIKKEK
ncbi:MAG: 50S ribosomal protein L19e [Candidatus Aenigmarchaeota archaeon]|nr:50S ribosomal protein L19e [Candidatus Aenigmarchaeota archaeon]